MSERDSENFDLDEEFVAEAFGYVGLDWREFVALDPRYVRPTEVDCLLADSSHARAL